MSDPGLGSGDPGLVSGIEYLQTGSGDAVIFLHGIGADFSSFHHQLKNIPGFRLIAWNMPGYGRSVSHQSSPDFKHLSERLALFIDGLGLKSVHLVGQSIGGMLTMEHACRRPDQVKSLVLAATTSRFGGRDEVFKTEFLKARLGPLNQGQTMESMSAKTANSIVAPGTPPEEVERIRSAFAKIEVDTWRGILQCLVTFDRHADLAKIVVPTLLIAGSEDQNAPAKTMKKMANSMQQARFHLIESAGHMLHQEKPHEFISLMTNFLKCIGNKND